MQYRGRLPNKCYKLHARSTFGIYSNVRFNNNEGRTKDENRQCLLVLMGATADGTKELIAVADGHRESELSWKEILLSLKSRGLAHAPELAIGDGALGFWKALEKVFPGTRVQRCTVHKTANILNKVPKSIQPQMKRMLHDIWDAPTKSSAFAKIDAKATCESYSQIGIARRFVARHRGSTPVQTCAKLKG